MSRSPFSLEVIEIASPCDVPWETMRGDDRVRHCDRCRLNVYNISALNRREAEALIAEKEGRLCIHYFRREDGTILTRDCPVGLWAFRARLARMFAAAAAMLGFLGIGGAVAGSSGASGSGAGFPPGPFSRLIDWLAPAPTFHSIAGGLCPPPAPPPLPIAIGPPDDGIEALEGKSPLSDTAVSDEP